jgi:hypothetical protein
VRGGGDAGRLCAFPIIRIIFTLIQANRTSCQGTNVRKKSVTFDGRGAKNSRE